MMIVYQCTFCDRTQAEVAGRMVTRGRGLAREAVCEDCVRECVALLAGDNPEPAHSPQDVAPVAGQGGAAAMVEAL